jgi:hypothetical protein
MVGTDPTQRVRVWLARVQQLVGWAGIAGIALLGAATIVIALAWSTQRAFVQASAARPPIASPQPAPAIAAVDVATPSAPELPPASEVPLLLTQMKQAAVGNGLDWRAAEYRITAATPTQPASLEVRCSIKGPYPKLRGMLVQLKTSIPAFAIREFSANRPNSDAVDIEAKLALAVFLQDGALASDTSVSEMATKGPP